ncbi:hypothetical protein [Paenibacillus puerhi]|uniref:hypothetical protein n=1 Tax=Paenibacillus puerhi TaxID=2692622 RepID=UPI001357562E|nr:hypothetical protein [Paenibacillus puerhi]
MAAYWLVPVTMHGTQVILGEERLELTPEELRGRFSRSMQAVHPRLLLPFKAHLLLSDESLEACGTDELPFSLEGPGNLVLDRIVEESEKGCEEGAGAGRPEWGLSPCAEAYVAGLMAPAEAAAKLKLVQVEPGAEPWYEAMGEWLAGNRMVMMLRED